jgi:hypothetical protein
MIAAASLAVNGDAEYRPPPVLPGVDAGSRSGLTVHHEETDMAAESP